MGIGPSSARRVQWASSVPAVRLSSPLIPTPAARSTPPWFETAARAAGTRDARMPASGIPPGRTSIRSPAIRSGGSPAGAPRRCKAARLPLPPMSRPRIHSVGMPLLLAAGFPTVRSYLLMPAVRPATICLVATRNSTTSGIVAMTSPANRVGQSVWYSPKNVVSPTGSV